VLRGLAALPPGGLPARPDYDSTRRSSLDGPAFFAIFSRLTPLPAYFQPATW
jgi:hypothetical protein